MSSNKSSGAYWEGGPARLEESILTRKTTTNCDLEKVMKSFRERLQEAKDDFDNTIADTDGEGTKELLGKEHSNMEINEIDQTVEKEVSQITSGDYEEKLKESYKLQYQAAEYIKKLKEKLKEREEVTKDLKEKQDANSTAISLKSNLQALRLRILSFRDGHVAPASASDERR